MSEDFKELEIDYYELGKSPSLQEEDLKKPDIPKEEKIKYEDLVKRQDTNPISIRERLNLLERRVEEIERSVVLVNKNFDDLRKTMEEKFTKLRLMDKKAELPEELKNELSSLKSIISHVSNVNEEIKQKTPNMLRELETRVDKFNDKFGSLREKIDQLEEENRKQYLNRPIILE